MAEQADEKTTGQQADQDQAARDQAILDFTGTPDKDDEAEKPEQSQDGDAQGDTEPGGDGDLEIKPAESGEASEGEDDDGDKGDDAEKSESSHDKDILKDAGLDSGEIASRIAEGGDLTKEERATLSKLGFTEALVNVMVRGLRAEADSARQISEANKAHAVEILGGPEAVAEFQAWARDNLTPEQIELYNQNTQSPNFPTILRGLAHDFTASSSEGSSGSSPSANVGITPFGSAEEMSAAIRSDDYKQNKNKFRELVSKRSAMTDKSNWVF